MGQLIIYFLKLSVVQACNIFFINNFNMLTGLHFDKYNLQKNIYPDTLVLFEVSFYASDCWVSLYIYGG